MSVGKQTGAYTDLAASDLVNSPNLKNGGWTDFVESPRMVEVPSQPEAKTVVNCSYSNSVRCTPAQGAVNPSRNVVGDMRWQEGSTSSRADRYRSYNAWVL